VVCSACGNENQVGNRFCGMCGTPLPHRPLTAPGAQGTHSFTRVPRESAKPDERGSPPTSSQRASEPDVPSQTGVLAGMPGTARNDMETSQSENSRLPTMDMVPEVPLEEYVKGFRYTPPTDSVEITMRGEADILRTTPSVEADTSATDHGENGAAVNPSSLPPGEDVRERLGLEDSPDGNERRDRPRFLEINPPAVPPGESATREAIISGPSFLGLNEVPLDTVGASSESEVGKARTSWRTWLAVAALVIFVALGLLEWRSQVNQTNEGPVEVVKVKLRDMMRRYSSPSPSANSADANAAKPAMQVEEQLKSQTQEPTSASPTAASATSTNAPPATSDAAAGTSAATSQQDPTPPAGSPVPARQRITAAVTNSSPTETQAASGRKAALPGPTPPPETAKAETAPSPTDGAQPATETPKPKPPTAQEANQEAPVKKAIPGAEEVAKANNASDSAAAAAWLWKAMAKGNPDAPVRLANMYVKGDGVPRSCEQALVLLQAAANKGDARARSRLATMYNDGTCVQRNRVKAYHWLMSALAADPTSQWAQQNRELFLQQMTPEERAQAEKSQ
jgi:zinc ribbon protein/Sel1 repeat-containing protein